MADTTTTNYGYTKPEPNASDDTWGGKLNTNWDDIDADLATLAARVTAAEAAITAAEEALKVPVGGLYLSTTDTDPATTLGYGTWVAFGEGRAIVGVGSNGESTWTNGLSQGSETHTLTTGEMPSHTHGPGSLSTNSAGAHSHTIKFNLQSRTTGGGTALDSGTDFTDSTDSAGAHSHSVASGVTGSAGSGGAHNNIQPSIGVYIWKRTA